jgi:hypothetical protein
MYKIHSTVQYFATDNPYATLFIGMGILISIAVFVDKKEGYY